jgi:hypothetical protein
MSPARTGANAQNQKSKKGGMKTIRRAVILAGIVLSIAAGGLRAQDNKPLYENNFESAEIDKVPDDFLVLDGAFTVKSDGTNKFLELPGAPLDSFGVLFGPTEKSDLEVSARIKGTSRGRRFPTFGVGLNGQEGYKLQVSPAKKMLELYKADEVIASVGYEWKSGQWTMLKLAVRKAGKDWVVEGKAWMEGTKEPESAMVSSDQKFPPPAGRASIWGQPYSTTPIQFDDLVVKRIVERP